MTHSIPEAVLIGNRILLMSPHPGQVKGELNSDGNDSIDPASGAKLSDRIHDILFADRIEEREATPMDELRTPPVTPVPPFPLILWYQMASSTIPKLAWCRNL